MTPVPRIGYLTSSSKAVAQALLNDVVARWYAAGVDVVGLIEEADCLPDNGCNAGVLRNIVSGKRYPIFLEEAPADTSCRIDAAGAERAGATVLDQIAACDLVVVSKFGKLEAAHGGLIDVFVAAGMAGKPILTTVSDRHLKAWQSFAPSAEVLPTDEGALHDWWKRSRQATA